MDAAANAGRIAAAVAASVVKNKDTEAEVAIRDEMARLLMDGPVVLASPEFDTEFQNLTAATKARMVKGVEGALFLDAWDADASLYAASMLARIAVPQEDLCEAYLAVGKWTAEARMVVGRLVTKFPKLTSVILLGAGGTHTTVQLGVLGHGAFQVKGLRPSLAAALPLIDEALAVGSKGATAAATAALAAAGGPMVTVPLVLVKAACAGM